MRHGKKRSAAITLVLAGTLSGCGEPEAQRDVYRSLAECQRDWPGAQQCESSATHGGSSRGHSSSWFYGPRYYGAAFPSGKPRPSPNAMDAFHAGRGGVSSGAARSGSTSSSSVARGGFGSTVHSFSSGS